MKTEIITKLKTYIEESEGEIGEIDFGDKEVCDIKSNYYYLAEFYIKFFNEFSRVFRDCKIPEVVDILENRKIFNELNILSQFKNRNSEFGKSRAVRLLFNYVFENQFEINEFFDLWLEIVE